MLAEDLAFQRRSWRVQRIGQFLFAVFVLAGLTGLFGGGGLWRNRTVVSGALRVEYPRFVRAESPFTVTLTVGDSAIRDGIVRLWLDDKFLQSFTLENITPKPREQVLSGRDLVLEFSAKEPPDSKIRFRLEAEEFGLKRHQLGLVGGDAVKLKQLVYP